MRNFKLTLEYDGAQFCGWQIQKKGERTVQGELEIIAQKIFKHPVHVIGSGRTDSGVHALGQVASIKADTKMKAVEVQRAFNSLLPSDIVVIEVKQVKDDFHAQYSVKEKTYRYSILNRSFRSAFLRTRVYFYPYPINLAKMRRAAKKLLGRHDFKSFQAHDPLRVDRDTVRTIKRLTIKQEGDLIHIEVTADGFLYKMVRNIVGTLLAIACSHLPEESLTKILKSKDRATAAPTAPPEGLCLIKVQY